MSERYCFDDIGIDVQEWDDYTGDDRWNAVYTIQLGELIDCGLFTWDDALLDWKDAAFDDEQYARVCAYFNERFYFREISIEPYLEWAKMLHRKIVYELMPKYRPLYERVSEGINPLSSENEYYKGRTIESAYPETLLSANADYITDGKDEEFQRINEDSFLDTFIKFAGNYKSVDEMMLDDLESMFISMYTVNMNSSW